MKKRTSAGARTLPSAYYTSEDVFAREGDRIFSRSWLYAGRASRLAERGSFILCDVERESLLLVRDGGEIRAFHNACRHRGTRLCTEPAGRFSRSIQCPYHAWTYGLDGRLLGAPHMEEVPGFSREDYPLHPVSVAAWEGCLFVDLADDPPPLREALAPIRDRLGAWRLAELDVAHSLTYDADANWKLVFQNYSECYHCPTLHPQLNRLTPYRDTTNDLEEGGIVGGPMELTAGVESMTMNGRRAAPPLVSGEDLRRVYYYTIFPNMFLSLHPDYVLIHRLQPIGPAKTRVVCDWLFHPEAMADPEFDPSGAIEFWNVTNQQDWRVCRLSQEGIASRSYVPGPYADLESNLAAFDRHYLGILAPEPRSNL